MRPSSRPRHRHQRRVGRVAQWFVLTLLVVVVAAISLGEARIRGAADALRGIRPSGPPPVTDAPADAAANSRAETELQIRLESAAASLSYGTAGVAVVNLNTGFTAAVNAERVFPAASLFKLPILVEVLAHESDGRLPADRLLEIGADDWTEGSGVLQARIGERLPARELRRLMIQESDNIAALVLLEAVGAANVNGRMTQLGLRETHVVDFRRGERGAHTTSPADMAMLLSGAAQGRLVDTRVSEESLRLMELPQAHTWLADGLPWWVKVAHKWGDLPEARNDVGVVFTPRGNYVVAVLTEEAPADEAQRLISRISQSVYEQLGR